MLKPNALSLFFALTLSACATPVPVAVTSPVPPPLPQILREPVSTAPNLNQQYDFSIQKFRELLNKAAKP